jgi:hypothetical protein
MAFLDFIKDRAQTQQPVAQTSQQPKQESAKEMYTREASQEQATRKPVEQMPEAEKQKAVEAAHPAAALMEKATQHQTQSQDAPSNRTDGKEALRHNQSGPRTKRRTP